VKGRRGQSGQNLVEFAIIVLLLLSLVLGIVEFGRAWMTFQVITNASREGARLAALPTGFSNTSGVTAKVNTYLTSANLSPARASVTVANVDGPTGTDAIVTVQYQADLLFLGPILRLMDNSSTLPGTLLLTGQATMRNE
jgi:Flp pilus assembly protein TadG